MPLIFTSNEVTASGHDYDDRTGLSYEYPRRYRNMITEGEPFIYYRGRRMPGGKTRPPAYFGAGIVGSIELGATDSALIRCAILDYEPFPDVVLFRTTTGRPLEQKGDRKGYYQPGVRKITPIEFANIVHHAFEQRDAVVRTSPTQLLMAAESLPACDVVSPHPLRRFAIEMATTELLSRFPGQKLAAMPHPTAGFDIRVDFEHEKPWYVKVKGVEASRPRFQLSEGERQFAQANADRYTILIVYGIDLATSACQVWSHNGAIAGPELSISPMRWFCEVIDKDDVN